MWMMTMQQHINIKIPNMKIISQLKHMLLVLKSSFEFPKQIFKLMDKKIFTVLCPENVVISN